MKNHRLASIILFTLAISTAAPAQTSLTQNHSTKHHHYLVVVMGGLGGPESIVYEQGTRSLNNLGIFTGAADTAGLDPNSPQQPCSAYFDFNIDPYIQHVSLGTRRDHRSRHVSWRNQQLLPVDQRPRMDRRRRDHRHHRHACGFSGRQRHSLAKRPHSKPRNFWRV